VLYYIKVMKFSKITKFGLFEDLSVLYYVKVPKFVKLAKFSIFEDFLVLLHKSHKVR